MAESSNQSAARGCNLHSKILQRVATVKNFAIAQAICHDEGHVSHITSGTRGLRINELEGFFNAIGLKVVECDGLMVSIPADELLALKLLARKGLL
jgi:hypothetical protein